MNSIDPRLLDWFQTILRRHKRVAVGGGPKTGKTTLVNLSTVMDRRPVLHTDEFTNVPWKEAPDRVVEWSTGLGEFVVEGITVPRALRKGLEADVLVWLYVPVAGRTRKQEALGEACLTVLGDWYRYYARELPLILSPPAEFYSPVDG